jgi:hypothetical protein
MPKDYAGRPDFRMAERVDEVLRTVEAYRRLHAARLMSALGVPFRVIVRVLAEPNNRRPSSTASQDRGVQPRHEQLPGSGKSGNLRRA